MLAHIGLANSHGHDPVRGDCIPDARIEILGSRRGRGQRFVETGDGRIAERKTGRSRSDEK